MKNVEMALLFSFKCISFHRLKVEGLKMVDLLTGTRKEYWNKLYNDTKVCTWDAILSNNGQTDFYHLTY